MRLHEILSRPDLHLTLLTGEEQLDRSIARAYTTDLLDPRRYLATGDLVLTGLMWRRGPADSDAFVAALAEAKVAALGAGDAALGTVPEDLVAACRRYGVPLFEVPVEVSFRTITDEITASLWRQRATGLATMLGRQRDMMTAVAAGARLADLLPPFARELGVSCWILSATGRQVAGTGALPEPVRAVLARTFLSVGYLPHTVTAGGAAYSLIGPAAARPGAWFLAVADPGTGPADLPEVVDELATLVALARSQRDEALRVEHRLATELVAAVDSEPAELRGRLRACRLSPDSTFVVLAATVTGSPGLTGPVVEELILPLSPGAALATGADPGGAAEVIAIAPVTAARATDLSDGVRAAALALAPGLRANRLAVGLSEPSGGAAGLGAALEEARHARRFAAAAPGAATVTSSAELASYQLLLASVSPAARRTFRDRLLGPLTDYDRSHGSDLVQTLDTFLSCSGSWSRCAEHLHVHVNTLRYRIRRIETLTGRNLGRFDDRVDFFLALRLPAVPPPAAPHP